jgi:subtilisin family serine protease
MRIGARIGAGAVVVGLVLGTVQAASSAAPKASSEARAGFGTVTLISGDQVVMLDETHVSVRPGAGREGIFFSTHTMDGHTFVVPSDAQRLVSTGQLDRRLFDVTTLMEFGYDDAHRDSVPVIVTGQAAPMAARVSRELPSIDGVALAADKTGATWEALTAGSTAAAGVTRVWLDGKRKATLDRSATQIGAPAAWDAGLTGAGVKVAVLDTGVDQTHPDLAGREIAERNFSAAPDNVDRVGHGTHVASIAAGDGAKSGGKFRGIADGASVLDGKVLDDNGSGTESEIVAGMEWAAQQGADIVNMSFGGHSAQAVDPVEQAVESLSAQHGVLFVAAAGNSGGSGTIDSPGSAPSALTVGAVDRENGLAPFSSRGPVGGEVKPDVTAPGVGIVAAESAAGTIGNPVEDGYVALSGTSMATPHVAGAAALLAQRHPDWTGQQLKSALTGSAAPTPGLSAYDQGAGRVDVARALDQTVVSEPVSVGFGMAAWPHDDDVPVNKSITYRNLGATDVTLELAVETSAPAGMFTVSADEVTVPAGGTASVTVTGDARAGSSDGALSGVVLATAGDSVTRTPVGLVREEESYNLTLNYVDDHGQPASNYQSLLSSLDGGGLRFLYDEDGSVTVRLPKGRYLLEHYIFTDTHADFVVQPGVALDRDLTFDVDARNTRPIDVTPPKPATLEEALILFRLNVDNGRDITGIVTTATEGTLSTGQMGDPLPGTTMAGSVATSWIDEDAVVYGLMWPLDEFPTGFTKVVRWRDLATVRMDLGPGVEGLLGVPVLLARTTSGDGIGGTVGPEIALPATQKVYVTTDGLRWRAEVYQVNADHFIEAALEGPERTYRAGRGYDMRLNYPMFGPGTPEVTRVADDIDVYLRLFADGDGNIGNSAVESGVTRLYLGDQLVGENPYVSGLFLGLPAEERNYRLTVEAVRDSRFPLTTAVDAEWTFSSARPETEWERTYLNVVRFVPKLDANGYAPAGKPFQVPLRVQDETGATVQPKQLSVAVSYDEGTTWQQVPVTARHTVVLHHPANATSVSLRASATDRDGNTVKQTVIRAYLLR